MASPYGMDLPSALNSGINQAAGMYQLESLKQDRQRTATMRDLMPKILAGGEEADAALKSAASVDPEAAMKLSEFMAKADERQQKKAQTIATNVAKISGLIIDAPDEELPQAYAWGLKQAEDMGIDVSKAPRTDNPHEIRQFLKLMQAQALDLKDQMPKYDTYYDDQGRTRKGFIDPIQQKVVKPVGGAKAESGTSLSFDPETGEFSFSQGPGVAGGRGAPLSKAGQNEVQKGIIGLDQSISAMARIKKSYDPQFLTYQGQLKGYTAALGSKLGMHPDKAAREFVQQRTKFVNQIEQVFNQYRKEITGAAASVQELDRLKKSLINSDQSPLEFEASYDNFMNALKLARKVQFDLMTMGITPRSREYADEFDQRFLGTLSGEDERTLQQGPQSDGAYLEDDALIQQYLGQ